MKAINAIVTFVVWVLVFVAGACVVAGAVYLPIVNKLSMFLYNVTNSLAYRAIAGCVGMVLMLVVVLHLMIIRVVTDHRMRMISFASSLGTINVSLDTIEAFLARSGSGLPDVSKLTVRLTPLEERKTVKADVRVSLYHGRNVREQLDRISHYIAESTKGLLGLEEIGEVIVTGEEVGGGESPSGADRM